MEQGIIELIEQGKLIKLTIKGEEITIGKLTLKQVIKLTKLLGKIFSAYSEQIKQIRTEGTTNQQDVLELFNLIDEQEVAEIISVIINKDVEFCLDIDFKALTDIIAGVIELNYADFEGILKNFQRISSILPNLKK